MTDSSDPINTAMAAGAALPVFTAVSKFVEHLCRKHGWQENDAAMMAVVVGAGVSLLTTVHIGQP